MFRISKPLMDALKVTAQGSTVVLLSTTLSCVLAVVIESSAHKLQYKLFPHWYKDVKYAMGLPHLQYQNNEDFNTASSIHNFKEANPQGEWNWSTSDEVMLTNEKGFHNKDNTNSMTWKDTSEKHNISLKERTDKKHPKNDVFQENTIFDTYQKKLQNSRSDLFNPERVSKMVHTTAMTM
jgi:hypothetical protein